MQFNKSVTSFVASHDLSIKDPLYNSFNSSIDESKVKFGSNAYKRRNVYKAIIRNMFNYVKKNKQNLMLLLIRNGFTNSEIKVAFEYIEDLNNLEAQKGKNKRSQNTLNKMVSNKNIYTYILRESLKILMMDLDGGKKYKIMTENLPIYKEVCRTYYNSCNNLLNKSPS